MSYLFLSEYEFNERFLSKNIYYVLIVIEWLNTLQIQGGDAFGCIEHNSVDEEIELLTSRQLPLYADNMLWNKILSKENGMHYKPSLYLKQLLSFNILKNYSETDTHNVDTNDYKLLTTHYY